MGEAGAAGVGVEGGRAAGDRAGVYVDLWAEAVLARLAALPAGAPALDGEIDALRALLRAVAADTALAPVERLAAFCKGVDCLGRLYRVQHVLAPSGAPGGAEAALDAVLA